MVSVDDLSPYEKRLERSAVPGSRQFPDGRRLEWRQIGIRGLIADPQLPYFLEWESDESLRPGALASDIDVTALEISGSADRLSDWLGQQISDNIDGVALEMAAPNGTPGINRVTFQSPTKGTVSI